MDFCLTTICCSSLTDHLRGVYVIAETCFVLTKVSQKFEWKECGFKLHVPEGSLPVGLDHCHVKIKVSLSGHFDFPENSELVSAIYWIYSPHTFVKPLTLEIQHCATNITPSQCARLSFVRTNCTQKELPYNFKELDGGIFKPNTCYGSISVKHFSGIGTVFKGLSRRNYCGELYTYKRGLNDWNVDFVVIKNLEACIKAGHMNLLLASTAVNQTSH